MAAAEAMSQHPTCLGGPVNPQGCSSPWVNINCPGGPPGKPRKWGVVTQGWRLGKLGAQSLLTWPFSLLSFPLLEIHVLLPASSV